MSCEGVFGSSITMDQLEAELQKGLETKATFGPARKMEDLGGGKGIASQMGLLTADWKGAEPGEELPETIAVKISAPDAPVVEGNGLSEMISSQNKDDSRISKTTRFHNAEVSFYEKVNSFHTSSLALPKIYCMESRATPRDSGYIAMDHIKDCASMHMCDNLPDHGIHQVLRVLATCESYSRLYSDMEKEEMSIELMGTIFEVMFRPGMIQGFKKMIRDFDCDLDENTLLRMEQAMDEFSMEHYIRQVDRTAEELGMKRVLCHGDVWMCNMMWYKRGKNETGRELEGKELEGKEERGEEHALRALIDWQTAHFGCAAVDLVRLLAGCLAGKERRERWKGYCSDMHNYLKEEWREKEQGDMPYTVEQLQTAYKRMFPVCAFVVVGSIAAVGRDIIGKKETQTEKDEAKTVLVEKQRCLIEDIVVFHEENMKQFTK